MQSARLDEPNVSRRPRRLVTDRTPEYMRHDSFKDFVLDQLGEMPELRGKAMFGGYGLYQRATFFGIIHKGRLYFKTNDVTQALYRARGMHPFRPNAKQTLAQYYEVPTDILEDPDHLIVWARSAVMLPSAQLLLPFPAAPLGNNISTAVQ